MKYLLGIGPTILQKYKKNANLRIFLDDVMIDDFFVEEKNISDKQWIDHSYEFGLMGMGQWEPSPAPEAYKTYIIDQHTLEGKKKFRIEVTNDDSNYTNGFMSRSTVLDLRHIFLLPIQFIEFFRHSAFSSREGNKYYNLCKNMDPIIHKKFRGQVDFIRQVYSHSDTDRYFGYPYPFRMFWNNEPTFGHLGGSGVFTIDLIKKSDIYLFDSVDDQFSEDRLHVGDHSRAPRTKYHPPGRPDLGELKLTGFPLSRSFLFWCQHEKLDKYLYEDK